MGDGLVITPWLCYCVEPCRTVTLSQKYIWQERRREGEGKTDTGDEEARRMVMVEGCRAIVEDAVWRSVRRCALLCPLLCIIPSMNISLITAEKAKWSRVEDACHTAPSAHITHSHLPLTSPCHISPCLQLSRHQHPSLSLTLHTFSLQSSASQHCPFPPSQLCPVSNITFTYVTMSFLLFPSLHHNPLYPPPHWMGREFLFTMGLLILPY